MPSWHESDVRSDDVGVSQQATGDMASAHSLEGLMKWLSRDEWRDAFKDVLDLHLLPACEATSMKVEKAVSILDQEQFMSTIWGCAFEDFLTRELENGRNIVDDYLKRRGWNEDASTRSYMSALRTSVMSLYEVSNVVKDTSFLARDLVRGGDPILISERSATRSLKQWDRIAMRVLRVDSQTIIAGGVLPFDYDTSENLLKMLRNTGNRALKEHQKLAQLIDCEADDPRATAALSETEVLRLAAPAFTTAWLNGVLDRIANPQIPEIQNTEGDELMFCTVQFPLGHGTTDTDMESALEKSRCWSKKIRRSGIGSQPGSGQRAIGRKNRNREEPKPSSPRSTTAPLFSAPSN
jgi:hypothetical protein